jgi:hypothetical protein
MSSIWPKTEVTCSEKTDTKFAAATLHLKKLLRAKNWLCSPLLRLPPEIIIHILSYMMEETAHSSVWRPIISTCHHIRKLMCTSNELWRRADFTSDKLAMFAFEWSQGNLEVILADLLVEDDQQNQNLSLRFCKDNMVLHGHRLHTLEVYGYPYHLPDFSWIFERPLPRLERLRIHFTPSWEEWKGFSLFDPVDLQLPTDMPLQVLDLCGAILPWSSNLFIGLRELHLDFRSCDAFVEISEEDMLGVFEASPQLESLSLYQLLSKLHPELGYTPSRVVKFASLKQLVLDSFPKLVGYMLDHMDVPVIESLKIRSEFSSDEVEPSLNYYFVESNIPGRLFPNPPEFEVWPDCGDGIYDSLKVNIGNCHIQFDFDMDENEVCSNTIMACILPMVPSSVTTLRLDYSQLDEDTEWAEFFLLHPEVRSIEVLKGDPVDQSLWDALSPAKTGGITLCPKLESITLSKQRASTPLLSCLLGRKATGFGLKCLRLWALDETLVRAFSAFVEEIQVVNTPPTELVRRVRPVLEG